MDKKKLLLVDDNDRSLKLLTALYETDYEVSTAQDGLEALEVLFQHKIDLVVTDILMPNMDGYYLCYKIRTKEALKNIPIIVYTATYTSLSEEKIAKEMGANMFIRKPAPMKLLSEVVQKIFSEPGKYPHKVPTRQESTEMMHHYSAKLVTKLEQNNIELEEIKNKLQQSEARLKEAQTLAHIGNWEIDMKSNRQDWSDEFSHLLGFKKNEVTPSFKLFLSMVHPDDLEFVNQQVKNTLNTYQHAPFHFRFIRKDKEVRYGYAEWRVALDEEQKPLRLYGIVQDVTDKKRVEQKIEFDHNNLTALINNTQDLLWSMDKEYRLITCNTAFNNLVQMVTGKSIQAGENVLAAAVDEEQRSRFQNHFDRALSGESFTIIENTTTPVELFVEISFYPIRQGDTVIGTACYAHNVTERLKAKKKLQDSLAQIQAFSEVQSSILDALPANIALLNQEGVIMEVNQSWKNFGLENSLCNSTHGVGLNYIDIAKNATGKDAETGAAVAHGIYKVIHGQLPFFEAEYACHSPTNQRWFVVMVAPIKGKERAGAVVMHMNITESKLAEQEIVRLNESLEIKVAERTAQLKENIKDLESFSYSVSHDLRSPLRSMNGFVKLVLQKNAGTLDQESIEFLNIISDSAMHMNLLVDELLELSRVNNKPLKKEQVDMHQLAAEVVKAARPIIQNSATEIKLQPIEPANGDATLLKQVWTNLISNAVKYSAKNPAPVIEVGSKHIDCKLVYYVQDNGAGFDMKYIDKLFGVFQRLHKATEFEGTGVGLTLVKRIVTRHEGKIWADAKVGQGATFYFTLSK